MGRERMGGRGEDGRTEGAGRGGSQTKFVQGPQVLRDATGHDLQWRLINYY